MTFYYADVVVVEGLHLSLPILHTYLIPLLVVSGSVQVFFEFNEYLVRVFGEEFDNLSIREHVGVAGSWRVITATKLLSQMMGRVKAIISSIET